MIGKQKSSGLSLMMGTFGLTSGPKYQYTALHPIWTIFDASVWLNTDTTYECPVCGFAYMDEPPLDHAICACCGTHFGYEDVTKTHAMNGLLKVAFGWTGRILITR